MPGSETALIDKKILSPGSKNVTCKNGSKVHFHFQTRKCNEENTLIDDSKKLRDNQPFELVLGKKFKLEVWEAMIQKMSLNEVAQFTVNKNLVLEYPFVSKTLRDIKQPNKLERRSHCCAMTLQSEGVGYDDLNELIKCPQDLQFIFELVKVEQPDDYEKETWQLTEPEVYKVIPQLREQGNDEFKKNNYKEASDRYAKAIGMIEQLMIKEKPHEEEWNSLDQMKVPFLLNFSQCKLNEGDYYAAIEHCTTVIKTDPNNVKAYFRRAKAHAGAWNCKEAIADFQKAAELDQSLKGAVKKEIQALEEIMKKLILDDKEKFKGLFN